MQHRHVVNNISKVSKHVIYLIILGNKHFIIEINAT